MKNDGEVKTGNRSQSEKELQKYKKHFMSLKCGK